MADTVAPPTGGMEGGGAYNAYATIQSAGAVVATRLLEHAANEAALDALRRRAADRAILVFHEDLPLNDFNTLFSVLEEDPNSYLRNRPNVFASAIGRSFYEAVLPANCVHLGWSAYAAMWLSRVPRTIPGHFWILGAPAEVRAEFEAQAAADWRRFLGLRATELRTGGNLVVSVPGISDAGEYGFGPVMEDANATLAELVGAGLVAAEERARMVHGALLRSSRDLLAPFPRGQSYCGLVPSRCDVYPVEDLAWRDYERDNDAGALAAKRAGFFRVTYGPTLAGALSSDVQPGRRVEFLEALEDGVRRRQAEHPSQLNSFLAAIALSKVG